MSDAGDVNEYGIDDIIIGTSGADPNERYNAGENYVRFGFDSSKKEAIIGTENDDVLTGTTEDDLISGLGGNDNLTGLAGLDTMTHPLFCVLRATNKLKDR